MKKRLVITLLGIVVFVAAVGAVKYGQVKKAIAQHANFQMPPETVTTVVTKKEDVVRDALAIGSVTAVQGVTVSAPTCRASSSGSTSSRASRCARARCSCSSTRSRSRRSSPPPRRARSHAASTSRGCRT